MKLDKHIAWRFLLPHTHRDALLQELLELFSPGVYKKYGNPDDKRELPPGVISSYLLLCNDNNKSYYVTESILNKLKLFKVKKTEGQHGQHYDWTFFKDIKPCKKTLIFPDNSLLRVMFIEDIIHFAHISFKLDDGSETYGQMLNVMFYVNRITGEECEHSSHNDVRSKEEFIYKLLCFFFFAENEEIIIPPRHRYGTQKTGKLVNSLDVPLIIVNNNWNVTSIRSEGFSVSGGLALRWSGPGRTIPKMVFIEPFHKHGYVRTAKKKL